MKRFYTVRSFSTPASSQIQIYVLAFLTFFLQVNSFQGEDIVNARENFLVGKKTDFWGGISTLVYSQIPSFGIRWQIWLALGQIILTSAGLRIILSRHSKSFLIRSLKFVVIYSSLLFGSQMTRDGLLFSILTFGFGILILESSKKSTRFTLASASLIIIIALSFRPWLSIAVTPLVIFFLIERKINVRLIAIVALCISIFPLLLDLGASKALKLQKSYPQQQVMMMDLAATHCYSTNEKSVNRSKEGLSLFTSNSDYLDMICKIYRPDTWESLTPAGHASSQLPVTDFWLIGMGDSKRYKILQNTWLKTIFLDPVSYIQNKIIFVGKVMVGSDSRQFSLNDANSSLEKLEATYKLPYEIAITLHLFSIFGCCLLLLLKPFGLLLRERNGKLVLNSLTISIYFSLGLWTFLSVIAYIGSNGRYTYSITLLSLNLYLSHLFKEENLSYVK